MRRCFWIGAGLALVWACGGKAVVDPGSSTGTPTGSGTGVGTPTGSATGSPTGTPTGAVQCDVGDCDTCINGDCAMNACSAEINACVANQQCIDLNDCWWGCYDQACIDACEAQYPQGATLLYALYDCMFCGACGVDCAGAWPCPG